MDLIFYYWSLSPGSKAVYNVLYGLEFKNLVKVRKINVNYLEGDQHSEWYKKINPYGTVPTLVVGDFILLESQAILKYLDDMFSPNLTSHPARTNQNYSEQEIAKINQWLYQDQNIYTLFHSYLKLVPADFSPIYGNHVLVNELRDALNLVDRYMADRKYLAIDELTIADLSFLCTLDCAEFKLRLSDSLNLRNFRNISLWMGRCKWVLQPGWTRVEDEFKIDYGFAQSEYYSNRDTDSDSD